MKCLLKAQTTIISEILFSVKYLGLYSRNQDW